MRQSLVLLAVFIGGLLCFTGYCTALIDWVQDYQTGLYAVNRTEALLETVAIVLYSCVGVVVLKRKVNLLP